MKHFGRNLQFLLNQLHVIPKICRMLLQTLIWRGKENYKVLAFNSNKSQRSQLFLEQNVHEIFQKYTNMFRIIHQQIVKA